MEARYDWLFWLNLSPSTKVLYITNEERNDVQIANCHFNFRKIKTKQDCISLDKKTYDVVYIDTLDISINEVMSDLEELVIRDGYFLIGRLRQNLLSKFLKKSILKHTQTQEDNENIIQGFNQVDKKIFQLFDELYAFPSVQFPWTLSNTDAILQEMKWWKRSSNGKVLLLQKIFSIPFVSKFFIRFWPESIMIYKKMT